MVRATTSVGLLTAVAVKIPLKMVVGGQIIRRTIPPLDTGLVGGTGKASLACERASVCHEGERGQGHMRIFTSL